MQHHNLPGEGPELHINQICQLYMYFPGDISSLFMIVKERKKIRKFHLALSSSPTEIGQKWSWKAFVDNYRQLLSEENNKNFEIFSLIIKALC